MRIANFDSNNRSGILKDFYFKEKAKTLHSRTLLLNYLAKPPR